MGEIEMAKENCKADEYAEKISTGTEVKPLSKESTLFLT